jgi:CheY-like chemotaxis protein
MPPADGRAGTPSRTLTLARARPNRRAATDYLSACLTAGMVDDPSEDLRSIEILLVEDDPGDTLLITDALEHHKVRNRLTCVTDGFKALDFLHRRGEFADAERPDLILLDLNLPRMDGRELLAIVKRDEELSAIPVVVLTTSDAAADVLRSYEMQANAYVVKPVDFDRFMDVVRQIDEFFLTVVALPQRPGRVVT